MKKLWFTLVELIVGITISMLLMVSVGIFVSTWMSNITLQKKVLDDNKKTSSDILYLQKNVLNSKKYISTSLTWILLRQNKYFDKWWFSYIWVKEFDWIYCWTWEITKTNHLYVSNFIPLTWVNTWTTDYKTDIKKHQVLKRNWWNWDVVVWKDIFWDKLLEWSEWTDVFLNSPTGLVEIDWKIVFSDTLNDRVLYLSGSKVYTLLDEKNWLNEPIWLAYNSTENSLYIANAGKWEILKLSSKSYSENPGLEVKNVLQSDIDKLEIEILEITENLIGSKNISDYSFSSSNDFIKLENNKIIYYFIWEYSDNQTRSECVWHSSWDIVLNYPTNSIKCTNNTWSWELASFKKVTIDDFIVQNIESNLSENKNYYVKLNLFKDDDLKFTEYYPYFTQWDNDIFTKNDNVLEVFSSWASYPIKVNSDWIYVEFNTGSFDPDNYEIDFIFSNPVKDLKIDYSSNLLNIKLNYYKYLNCFNADEKIDRNFLIKKSY